jgi:ankyrin repeat protein
MSLEQDKYPIHFAAESLDTGSLRALLEADRSLANEKCDDITPLHIIVECINTENFEIVFEAIKILLKYDADINCPASRTTFHTPFTLLVKKLSKLKHARRLELLDYVISNCPFVDVDTYRKGEARTLLEKNFPELLPRFAGVSTTGDQYESSNKDQIYAKLMKHLEADERQFILELQALKSDSRYNHVMNDLLGDGMMLEETVSRGLEASVQELLAMGVDVNRSSRESTYTPIGIASQRGYWKILKMLAVQPEISFQNNNSGKNAKRSNNPLLPIVVKNMGMKSCSEATDYQKCFDYLLVHPNVDVNAQDETGNTALHYAVRYKNEYAAKKLLEKSTYLGTANIFKNLPINDISPELLEEYFDSCITTNGDRQGDNEFEIRIDYSCLVPTHLAEGVGKVSQTFVKELTPIQYMASTKELRHLIQHPLISSFLFLKWFRLSPIFYTNLAVFSVYCLALTSYIVFYFDEDTTVARILRNLSVLGAMYVLIREIIQFVIAPWNYVKCSENYLEIGLICLTGIIVCASFCGDYDLEEKKMIQQIFGTSAIMLAAVELSLLVGSLPFFSISTHMVMLKTVSMSFLRGLLLYSIILVAFALSFYTLFSGGSYKYAEVNETLRRDEDEDELNKFTDPGRAIIKTIVMLTGEFEASSIDFNQNPMSYLIFVLFLFFMSIVVLNLLNGLAVSDTQLIKSEAELNNWLERTRLLVNYEKNLIGRNNNFW